MVHRITDWKTTELSHYQDRVTAWQGPKQRQQQSQNMEILRHIYEPQREKQHKAASTLGGRERDSGRGREDLVREREHKIHHATGEPGFSESRTIQNNKVLTPITA